VIGVHRTHDAPVRSGRERRLPVIEFASTLAPGGINGRDHADRKAGEGPGMARSVEDAQRVREIMQLFDVVIESRNEGVRKPDPRFYRLACERLQIEPARAVFLDDLGINLKPARELGMQTIKVESESQAIAALSAILDLDFVAV